ncbi:hypothetical protein VVR26_07185 [Corynebacterium camporealensis]|uniref:hypothetical protein n=1 Tax=Corynebacterium camporealensis TaxID=161896 RepID=UPI0034CF2882
MFSRAFKGAALALSLSVLAAPVAHAAPNFDPNKVPPRTQMTLRLDNGHTISTPNGHESRPALSLSKLYLGMWVMQHGAPGDKARVEQMIRYSDDNIATDPDRRYPQAIDSVARQYGLPNTHRNGFWGNSTTSTQDVTKFINAVYGDPAAAPLFRGMNNAAPVAADGYRQDFGTAHVPGVTGTKFGWADNRRVHATVSRGPGFSIAANTYGPAGAHTADVRGAVRPGAPSAPQVPGTSSQQVGNQIKQVVPPQFHRQVDDATNAAAQAERQACAAVNQALTQAGPSTVC